MKGVEDESGGKEMEKVMKGCDEVIGLMGKEEEDLLGGGCEGMGSRSMRVRMRMEWIVREKKLRE